MGWHFYKNLIQDLSLGPRTNEEDAAGTSHDTTPTGRFRFHEHGTASALGRLGLDIHHVPRRRGREKVELEVDVQSHLIGLNGRRDRLTHGTVQDRGIPTAVRLAKGVGHPVANLGTVVRPAAFDAKAFQAQHAVHRHGNHVGSQKAALDDPVRWRFSHNSLKCHTYPFGAMRVHMLMLVALASVALAGCVDDSNDAEPDVNDDMISSFEHSHPSYGFRTHEDLPEGTGYFERQVRDYPTNPSGVNFVSEVGGANTAGGIATIGNLAIFGGRSTGPMEIVDISDPTNPQVIGTASDSAVRDASTILYPDGRVIVISTAGGREIFATDITNPTNPELIGQFETPNGNHNIAVVPGTPIVYNSGKDIVDFSDPTTPQVVGRFSDAGEQCHDITFYVSQSEDKFRAYCAGYPTSEIWDIADPTTPMLIHKEPFPTVEKGVPVVGNGLPDTTTFALSFSHLAMVNEDASVLIVGDETGGGAIDGCDVYVDALGNTLSGPLGNLWFYDLSDETNPVLKGHLSPSVIDAPANGGTPGSCTAHFGQLIPGGDFLTMAFYDAGVTIVDFSDIDNPVFRGQYGGGGSIWDVWVHDGYLYTGDMTNGMQVLSLS